LGAIESVKTADEVKAPVSGEVVKVNDALSSAPELVNESPQTDGWVAVLKLSDPAQLDDLMYQAAYEKWCEEDHH
jgi:glycine cleavage system H protein